jgi:hypothetical protein
MRRACAFVLVWVFTLTFAQAQDHIWWHNNVNWDGVTHWSSYITSSAGKMGPNALPVPILSTGSADSVSSFEVGTVRHHREGDQTFNLTTKLNLALIKQRLSVELFMVPVEWFNVSHALKEERKIFYQHYYETRATGDLYSNTNIQLLQQQKYKIDAAIRLGLKTASSNNQGAARFTNAPGYYFDVSVGKSFYSTSNSIKHRVHGMLGFYAWQTNYDWQQQDDAILYGLGYQAQLKFLVLEQSLSGYHGYLDNGDRPIIYKARLSKSMGNFRSSVYYWHGFHDYIYKSIGINLNYTFARKALLR